MFLEVEYKILDAKSEIKETNVEYRCTSRVVSSQSESVLVKSTMLSNEHLVSKIWWY